MKKQFLCMVVTLSISACMSAPQKVSREGELATIVATTLTARPVPFTPIPTLTPANRPALPAGGPLLTATSAQNVNLRTQPGLLFPVSRVMAQGTRLRVLGFSPGEDWVSVINDEGVDGWVDTRFIEELPAVGLTHIDPTGSQLVRGRVTSENGFPINGVGFTVTQTTASKSLRSEA